MNVDLQAIREDLLKMSQRDCAQALDIELEELISIERDKQTRNIDMIEKLIELTGKNYDGLKNYVKEVKVEFNPLRQTLEEKRKNIDKFLDYQLTKSGETDLKIKQMIAKLKNGFHRELKKPTLSVVGYSDSGKSTMLNSLLREDVLPANWQPTTSLAIYIQHIDDRPSFIKSEAVILKEDERFMIEKLEDKTYFEMLELQQGDMKILLKNAIHGERTLGDASTVVIYCEAPILKLCTLVDLPGYGTETESDNKITATVIEKSDFVIYFSKATAFLSSEQEHQYLRNNVLKHLTRYECKGKNHFKPLSNLFIVASQSDMLAKDKIEAKRQIEEVKARGRSRFLESIPPSSSFWDSRKNESGYCDFNWNGRLGERFYYFTTEHKEWNLPFLEDLKETLELLPELLEANADNFLNNYIERNFKVLSVQLKEKEQVKDQLQRSISQSIEEEGKLIGVLEEIKSNESRRQKESKEGRKRVKDGLKRLNQEAIHELTSYYNDNLKVAKLEEKIKESGMKKKKEEIQRFSSTVINEFQEKCEEITLKKSKEFGDIVKTFLREFEEKETVLFSKYNISTNFHFVEKYFEGLAAISSISGIGAFAMLTFGPASWLATTTTTGFWIFAQTTVTTTLLGSVATLASTIAFPLTIGILAILGTIKIFGDSWRLKIAKKMVEQIEKEEVLEKYVKEINKYWLETEKAFDLSVLELENKWQERIAELEYKKKQYQSSDKKETIKQLTEEVDILNKRLDFLSEIPCIKSPLKTPRRAKKYKLRVYCHPSNQTLFFKRYINDKEVLINNDSKLFAYNNSSHGLELQTAGWNIMNDIMATFDGEPEIILELMTSNSFSREFEALVSSYGKEKRLKINVYHFKDKQSGGACNG